MKIILTPIGPGEVVGVAWEKHKCTRICFWTHNLTKMNNGSSVDEDKVKYGIEDIDDEECRNLI